MIGKCVFYLTSIIDPKLFKKLLLCVSLVNLMTFIFTCTYLTCILGDVTAQIALQPALKFNGGGHINHSIFWTNLSPNGGGEPQGKTRLRLYVNSLVCALFSTHANKNEL